MAGRILHRSPWVCLGFYMVCVVFSRISCDFGRGAPSPSLAGWPAGRLAGWLAGWPGAGLAGARVLAVAYGRLLEDFSEFVRIYKDL